MTSFGVKVRAGIPCARYQPLTPAAYALTIVSSRRPAAPWDAQRVELVGEIRLGIRARDERGPGERKLDRVEPWDVERRDPRGATDQLQQQPAVGGGHPARAERDVGLGPPRDVCDAEGVTEDRHARAGALPPLRLLEPEPERRGLEVAAEVARGHVAAQRCQPVVERGLVTRVPVEREAPVLARREHRPGGRRVVPLRGGVERRERERDGADEGHDDRGSGPMHGRQRTSGRGPGTTPDRAEVQSSSVDALLAFAAALVALRLSGELARRYRDRRSPELAAWSAALAAYALAAGALAWGAAAGWSEAAFRVYYLGGALLTAPLLGAGSLLLVGRRSAGPVALVYAGVAVGVALAVPLETTLGGSDVPEAQDVLELWPARILAILANSRGHAGRRRRRPRELPRAAARERAHPGRRRSGRARQRARGPRRGRARSRPRGRGDPALPRFRHTGSSSGERPGSVACSRLARRSRIQTATRTPATASATMDSTIAPGIPPCAINAARAATSRRRCTGSSARASGTASVERRRASRTARPRGRARRREPRRVRR